MIPQDFINAGLDSLAYRDLRRTLRGLPERERLDFILGMGEVEPKLAWALANACLRRREHVEAVFRHGFLGADAHDMQYLFRATVPRLGVIAVARIVGEYSRKSPSAVSAALYYIGRFPRSRREQAAVDQLEKDAALHGISGGPIRTPA